MVVTITNQQQVDSDLWLLLFLILLSAAFSGAEIALTSLTPAKVKALKDTRKFGSNAVWKLKKKPQNTLITILIGNNLVNILATVVATLWGVKQFGSHAVGIVTGVLTALILIFGEITPKTLAQKYSESFSRMVAHPLNGLTWLFSPIVWLINRLIQTLMKIFKAENPIQTMSEEELLAMVDIGTREGVIEEHEQEFIENVLEFTDTTVEEIMTIQKNIESLEISTSIRDAALFFMEHSHSRIPVFRGNLDHIIGIITVHDILRLTNKATEVTTLADLHYQDFIVVPKTKSINKLFLEFKKRRQHLAMVVDEHGKTVGLVTLEDILEEIVGEIADEQDKEVTKILPIGKNEWEVSGETTIEELNEALDIEIEYPVHKTVSLLILEELQGFPSLGERINYQGISLQVRTMGKNRIDKVVITKIPPEEKADK